MEGNDNLDVILKLGIVLVVGILGEKVARRLALPDVTGYLVAGLFIGPSLFNIISPEDATSFAVVNEVALAAIAFSIGSEFLMKEMKKLGKNIVIISTAQVIGALLAVFTMMYWVFGQEFVFSLVIASMSVATAPAATIMVIRQYKTYGPLTKTILPVVAIDDAMGIMIFGIAMSVAHIYIGGSDQSFAHMISQPFIEIFGSLILGFIIGVVLTYTAKKSKSKEQLLVQALAGIALSIGLANLLELSALLTCMMLGATLVNLMRKSKRIFDSINQFTPPVYLLFFTLAGASLDIKVLAKVGLLGIGYIIARATGKIIGATIGARAVKADPMVQKYLGFTLLPQGGISIGLAIIVAKQLPQYSEAIITVIMFSVFVFEISGPIFAKMALKKAGEFDQLKG